MTENKKVHKVARCVHTLLESEGVVVSLKKVGEVIKDKDLSNLVILKDAVKEVLNSINDMRDGNSDNSSNRQQRIETFMVQNWSQIRDDEVVRAALLDAYCKGRIKRDKRQEMQEGLVKRCEGDNSVVNSPVQPEATEDVSEFDF